MSTNRTLLIFAAGRVGAALTKFLISRNDALLHVFAAKPSDQKILDICHAAGIEVSLFSKNELQRICDDGRKCDWILNLWSPHILPAGILNLAEHRLNTHPGYVPYCLGNDCAAWAIREGSPAGVSLLEITPGIDQGDVFARRKVSITFPMTGAALHDALEQSLIDLFISEWPKIVSGKLSANSQCSGGTYHTRAQTNRDRTWDGHTAASLIDTVTWILAHDFGPDGTTAEMNFNGKRYKLRLSVEEINS